MSSKAYQHAFDQMTEDQKDAMYDLFMSGTNKDGFVWVRFGDVEDLIAYHFVKVPYDKKGESTA